MRVAGSAILTALSLACCAVGPDYRRPGFPVPARYGEGAAPRRTVASDTVGGAAQRLVPGADVAADWWDLFRAPALDALVLIALRDNPGVAAAKEALRNAEELTLSQYAGLLPAATGNFNRQYEQEPGALFGGPANAGLSDHFYEAQLSPVSYNFDVWGGTRRGIEQRAATADYQRSLLLATDLTLVSNVVSTAIAIAALESQIRLQRDLVGYGERYLATLEVQFQSGAANGTDLALEQSTVAQERALIPPLETSLAQDRHLLASYLGRVPEGAELPRIALDDLHLPPELPLGTPAALLDHRPDIGEAEAQLHAATAAIGVAVAARLPQVSLSGFLGSASIGPQDLFTGGSGLSELIAQVTQPIFQGGALLHNQRAAEATARQEADLWRQTVIGAFQQVADVLSQIRNDGDLLRDELAADRAARRALDLAEMQYHLGGVALLTVLQAEIAYQNAAISLVNAQARRFSDSVALFVALGGGWWHRDEVPPPPPGVLPSLLPWSAS